MNSSFTNLVARAAPFALIACGLSTLAPGQTIDVGSGSPDAGVKLAFINAWQRNGFNTLVADPTANVAKYGTAGLAQTFPALSGSGTLALIKPDTTDNYNVQQVKAAMYAYYTAVGVSTAGYPASDTQDCPTLLAAANLTITCQWQPFTTNYALFVYSKTLQTGGQNFATRDPFYTKWAAFNGVQGLGPANSAETAITSQFTTKATVQTYDRGAIYNITSGAISGRVLAVKEPVYDLYVSLSAHGGTLGLPVTEELLQTNGNKRQSFEGGAIEYNPATGIAVLRPAIAKISLVPSGQIHLNTGDTLSAQVTLLASDGTSLTDRTVDWHTSNGQVAQIQSSGLSATIKAIAGGTAVVTVAAEGKTSGTLTLTVTAQCCQIGEGAPAAIRQAFINAVTRSALSVQLPAASSAARVGNGYVQTLQSTASPSVPYLIAVPDASAAGYVVTGAFLDQYNVFGGPAGLLGYPLSDATPGGRQNFQQGALAGNPIQVVSGPILAKWAQLGYETGTAGQVTGSATPFQTFRGTAGSLQFFKNALIVATSTGSLAGKAYAVMGPVLAAYNAAGGPGGDLGSPISDERLVSGLNQQDFESGSINYAPGSPTANVVKTPRQPVVTATPLVVIGGSSVRLVAGGFANGATVRVSQTGQPDFLVTLTSGAYVWDAWVPATAAAGVVTITATDVGSNASASASYSVRSAATAPLTISAVSGDGQNGAPGALLTKPLVVVVRDQDGNPAPGRVVTFAASPGALVASSAITASDGTASTTMRLPSTGGIALATAQAGHDVVTFSAVSAAFSLANFPALTQAVDGTLGNGGDTIRKKGALLTAAASILRYYQQIGALPQPNGLAAPASLNQFLKSLCFPGPQGTQICDGFIALGSTTEQTVNLWRVGAFVGGASDVRVEPLIQDLGPSPLTDLNPVRDIVASGSPVLLALSLASGGSHFVVANGIAADGSILIADPSPDGAQTNLSGYLGGFTWATATGPSKATIAGAVRLVPNAPAAGSFLVVANAPVNLTSASGTCGTSLQFPDTAASAGVQLSSPPGSLYFRACDGAAPPYQLDLTSQGGYVGNVTGLATVGGRADLPGTGPASSLIVVNGSQYTLAPVTAGILAGGVVNAASFTAAMAPGEFISIFGTGLVQAGSATTVQINGQNAPVIAASAFQVNAEIPVQVSPGAATLAVNAGGNTAQQTITLNAVAPAIFSTSVGQAAITNQDNTLNTPSNPASRTKAIVIYCTGLGAVTAAGGLSRANATVSVVIGGTEIPAAFAGLTPGFVGLYQVNVILPAALPPGLGLPLYLKQAGTVSNTVSIAVQ